MVGTKGSASAGSRRLSHAAHEPVSGPARDLALFENTSRDEPANGARNLLGGAPEEALEQSLAREDGGGGVAGDQVLEGAVAGQPAAGSHRLGQPRLQQ